MTIARLPKPEFTTGEVKQLCDADASSISKELGRLASLGVIRRKSRRGDYERIDGAPFWSAIVGLAEQ